MISRVQCREINQRGLVCEQQEGVENGDWMDGGKGSSLKRSLPFSVVLQYPAREEENCDGMWGWRRNVVTAK